MAFQRQVADMQQWRPGERDKQIFDRVVIPGEDGGGNRVKNSPNGSKKQEHVIKDAVVPQVSAEFRVE